MPPPAGSCQAAFTSGSRSTVSAQPVRPPPVPAVGNTVPGEGSGTTSAPRRPDRPQPPDRVDGLRLLSAARADRALRQLPVRPVGHPVLQDVFDHRRYGMPASINYSAVESQPMSCSSCRSACSPPAPAAARRSLALAGAVLLSAGIDCRAVQPPARSFGAVQDVLADALGAALGAAASFLPRPVRPFRRGPPATAEVPPVTSAQRPPIVASSGTVAPRRLARGAVEGRVNANFSCRLRLSGRGPCRGHGQAGP